jgi:hypothetical protein
VAEVRLTELKPEYKPAGATCVSEAKGIQFDCPGCVGTERSHRIFANFARGQRGWTEQGTSFENLTFIDAPTGSRSVRMLGVPCHSHFNITNGEIDFYGDSHSP